MKMIDLHGANSVADVVDGAARMATFSSTSKILKEAAEDIRSRHSDKVPYSLTRVALRNAIFRVSESNTALCPSPIFRALEAGEIGVGEATDRLEILLRMLASGVAQSNLDYDGDRP